MEFQRIRPAGPVNVNGAAEYMLLPPDPTEWSQLNSLLGSVELTVSAPSGWQHRFTGFDYLYRYNDVNLNGDPDRASPLFGQFDFPRTNMITSIARDSNIRAIIRSGPGTIRRSDIAWKMKTEYVGNLDLRQPMGSGWIRMFICSSRLPGDGFWRSAGGRFVHNSAIREHRRAARGADFAGVAWRGNFFWNPAAIFLCHRLQGASAGRDVCRAAIFRSESRPEARARSRFRGRLSAGFFQRQICL